MSEQPLLAPHVPAGRHRQPNDNQSNRFSRRRRCGCARPQRPGRGKGPLVPLALLSLRRSALVCLAAEPACCGTSASPARSPLGVFVPLRGWLGWSRGTRGRVSDSACPSEPAPSCPLGLRCRPIASSHAVPVVHHDVARSGDDASATHPSAKRVLRRPPRRVTSGRHGRGRFPDPADAHRAAPTVFVPRTCLGMHAPRRTGTPLQGGPAREASRVA
jgi:hypothetical protein